MKVYKKLMNALAAVEKIVLVISTLLILVLTVGNVFSRKVIHRSWSFTEELVVAVFVLITLLAAALACREKGGQINDQCNLIYLLLCFPDPGTSHCNLLRSVICMCHPLFRYISDDRSYKYVLRNQ